MATKPCRGNVSYSHMCANTTQSVDHHMYACVYYINSQNGVMATKPCRGNVSNSHMCANTRQSVDHHMYACMHYIDSQKRGYGDKAVPGKCLELTHVCKHNAICGPPYVCVCVLYRLPEKGLWPQSRAGEMSRTHTCVQTQDNLWTTICMRVCMI